MIKLLKRIWNYKFEPMDIDYMDYIIYEILRR